MAHREIAAALLVTAAAAAVIAADAPDPIAILNGARQKVLAREKSAVNFTCVETVTRTYYAPRAASLPRLCDLVLAQREHPPLNLQLRISSLDRLRFDVTLAKSGELYSWLGGAKFEGSIDTLVKSGPASSGSFGAYLFTLFENDNSIFTFSRRDAELMEYKFSVPQDLSRYRVKLHQAADSAIYTAYSGTIRIDAETWEIASMDIVTAILPIASGSCQSRTRLDFNVGNIAGVELLLPSASRQRFIGQTNDEVENLVTFSNCREYRGESTITFGEPGATAIGARKAALPEDIPAGLPFTTELTAPINTATAAAGDLFTARLAAPVFYAHKNVPEGSVIEGRLTQVETFYTPNGETVVAFRTDNVTVGGTKMRLVASPNWSRIGAERKGQAKKGIEILIPPPGDHNSYVTQFPGESPIIPKGYRIYWKTAK